MSRNPGVGLRTIRQLGTLLALVAISFIACSDGENLDPSAGPIPPVDPIPTPPADPPDPPDPGVPAPPDPPAPVPPPEPPAPPPAPPPDPTPGPPAPPPSHVGIPFGPAQQPPETFSDDYTGALIPAVPDSLIGALESARRHNLRILVNFSGHSRHMRDPSGFSMAKWQARVDRFRGLDLSSYIADGTIIGHFLLDEPSDPANWNGDRVTGPEIDEMAKYSKSVWPTMAAIIRTYPVYLAGHQYKYLDAVRIHYVERLGPINDYNSLQTSGAKSLGLALIQGLNVLNGSKSSGIPGKHQGKFAMSASEIRNWGGVLLSEPYLCAFFIWEYESNYLSRPEIKAALADLRKMAEGYPKKTCKTK